MTANGTSRQGGTIPPLPAGYSLPFYYGTFTNIGFDYLVEPAKADALVAHLPGLSPALFKDGGRDKACLSFNYQMYFAQFADGCGVTQEIELNVVTFPTAEAARTPKPKYQEYAEGQDAARLLGFSRIHVACDSQVAIDAGVNLFNEPKFKARFEVAAMPVPNGDKVTWDISCLKDGTSQQNGELYFRFTADLTELTPRTRSISPFTEYGSVRKAGRPDDHSTPLAAPLNVFQPYQWYDLSRRNGRVAVHPGNGPAYGRIRAFMDAIVEVSPIGAWYYQSPPVAAQNRPYYVPITLAQPPAERSRPARSARVGHASAPKRVPVGR
jgi:hypothetical protein